MFMTCRHIKTNGLQCQSPALKGRDFCYYHSKTHTIPDDVKYGPLVLPVPEDPAAIQISVARINEAVLRGYLDLRKAQLLLSGLKLAARFIDPRKFFDAESTVQSVESDTRGEELAPQKLICDDDDDCNSCPHAGICSHPGHPGDDDYQNDEDEDDDYEDDEDDKESEAEEINENIQERELQKVLADALKKRPQRLA